MFFPLLYMWHGKNSNVLWQKTIPWIFTSKNNARTTHCNYKTLEWELAKVSLYIFMWLRWVKPLHAAFTCSIFLKKAVIFDIWWCGQRSIFSEHFDCARPLSFRWGKLLHNFISSPLQLWKPTSIDLLQFFLDVKFNYSESKNLMIFPFNPPNCCLCDNCPLWNIHDVHVQI